MNKKIISALFVLAIVTILGWYINQNSSSPAPINSNTAPQTSADTTPTPAKVVTPVTSPTPKPTKTTATTPSAQTSNGRIVFGITDKAFGLDAISSINMGISEVWIHNPTSGWIPVSKAPQSFELLQLKSAPRAELLADINLAAGAYDSIRLVVNGITIKKNDNTTTQAQLPSNVLTINSNIKIVKNTASSVLLDVLADKSLHQTVDGKLIFAPVIAIETKSEATVQTSPITNSNRRKVEFLGGDTNYNATIGMDITGVTRVNDSIDPLANLEIVNGVIRIIPKN